MSSLISCKNMEQQPMQFWQNQVDFEASYAMLSFGVSARDHLSRQPLDVVFIEGATLLITHTSGHMNEYVIFGVYPHTDMHEKPQ